MERLGIVGEVGTMTTFSYKSPQGAGNANTALDTWAFGALISVASRGPFQLVSDLSASFFGESAYASTDAGGTYVASAGESLPANRRLVVPKSSPDAGLNVDPEWPIAVNLDPRHFVVDVIWSQATGSTLIKIVCRRGPFLWFYSFASGFVEQADRVNP